MARHPVLTDENIWPEFVDAVRTVGETWTAPSGRVYELEFDGKRLTVWLEGGATDDSDEVDADLLELAAQIHDAAGGIWSSDAVRQTASFWGFTPAASDSPHS
ncbi:MAG TPA: hypothetical protein VM345_04965 [Acidimicrobiales bacterium]|jgi:hypothetical protein|nr:hypothetical protein [Acidimicrobiales bacterium]